MIKEEEAHEFRREYRDGYMEGIEGDRGENDVIIF